DTLIGLGARTLGQAALVEAREELHQALHLFRQIASPRGISNSLVGLGIIACLENDYRLACSYCEEACQTYRNIGHRYGMAYASLVLGYAQQGLNEVRLACRSLRAALEETLAIGAVPLIPQIIAAMANQLLLMGQTEQGAT